MTWEPGKKIDPPPKENPTLHPPAATAKPRIFSAPPFWLLSQSDYVLPSIRAKAAKSHPDCRWTLTLIVAPHPSKAETRPSRTGTFSNRHQTPFNAGSMVHFAPAIYTHHVDNKVRKYLVTKTYRRRLGQMRSVNKLVASSRHPCDLVVGSSIN
jgi:hypothetical protein